MRLKRENESLVFALSLPERLLLAHVLRELAEKYRLKPSDLDARIAAAWYSPRGCAAAGMSAEETKEWLEHLHAFKKNAGLQRLEEWAAKLADSVSSSEFRVSSSASSATPPAGFELETFLRIPVDQAAAFVTVINDYRLAAAAGHDIGQTEMDAHSPWQLAKFPPARQQAVLQIHFLAWMIEETLRVTGP